MGSYEPVGSRTGVFADTKDGYEMIKVSRICIDTKRRFTESG